MFRAVIMPAPARLHNTSPDIDRSLRWRDKFRKPARVVVMPVGQHDIRGRIKVDSHFGSIWDQSLTRARVEQDFAPVRFDEQLQPEFGHVSRFGEGIDKAVNRG